MKKSALPLALMGVLALQACDNKNNEAAGEAATGGAPASSAALDTSERRLSYGIGYGMGQRMNADSVPIEADAFTAGLKDALSGAEAQLTQEQISAEMQAFQAEAAAKAQAERAKAAEENAAAGAAFLADNGKRDGVVTTESGLQYEVIEAGSGAKPTDKDTVEVHYRGTLIDGTEFDSSYGRGQTVKFGVTQVIPGWTEALQLMPAGSKWKLAIPGDLAYGPAGAGGGMIGPNATLLFDVELVSIPSQEEKSADEK